MSLSTSDCLGGETRKDIMVQNKENNMLNESSCVEIDMENSTESKTFNEQNKKILSSMLGELRVQLEYYFSPDNLKRDTFLQSVMNSTDILPPTDDCDTKVTTSSRLDHRGHHAPISMISRFGKVQQIVHKFENQRLQLAESTTVKTDDVFKMTYFKMIPYLIRDAALISPLLEVVILALPCPSPLISSTVHSPTYRITHCDEVGEINKSHCRILAIDIFQLGVGPLHLQIQHLMADPQTPNMLNEFDENKQRERNTIIFRDVPTSVGEEDIKKVFSWDKCPSVKSIHRDVGNCWFVTLDGSNDEIIDTLIELRGRKLNNEYDIKARLKSESTVSKDAQQYSPSTTPQFYYRKGLNITHDERYYDPKFKGGKNRTNVRSRKYGPSDPLAYKSHMQQHPGFSCSSNVSHNSRYTSGSGYKKNRSFKFINGEQSRNGHQSSFRKGLRKVQREDVSPPQPPPLLGHDTHFPSLLESTTSHLPIVKLSKGSVKAPLESLKSDDENVEGNKVLSSMTTHDLSQKSTKISEENVPQRVSSNDEKDKTLLKSGYAAALLNSNSKNFQTTPAKTVRNSNEVDTFRSKSLKITNEKTKMTNKCYSFEKSFHKNIMDASTGTCVDGISDSTSVFCSVEESNISKYKKEEVLGKEVALAKDQHSTGKSNKWGGKKSFADVLKERERIECSKKLHETVMLVN